MTRGAGLRTATPADAERLARSVVDGLADYGPFVPPGWTPVSVRAEAEHLRALLADARVTCLLAEDDRGAVVGQVTVLPATDAPHPVQDPRLAHLRNLFVHRERWGSGLASTLHAAAVAVARERGFTAMRLFTPARHGRARRFYEREGWVAVGAEFHDPGPGLVLVEYRRALG